MVRVHQSFSINSGKKDFLEQAGDACLFLGRVAFGYRKISLGETPQAKKINRSAAHILLFLVTLPLSSLVALSGLALITLSNTHKKKCRLQKVTADVSSSIRPSPTTSAQSPTSPRASVEKKQPEESKLDVSVNPDDEKTKSQLFLQELSQAYRSHYGERKGPDYLFCAFDALSLEEKPGIRAHVDPNGNVMSNLILECQEESEVYFLQQHGIDLTYPKKFELLRDTLQAAFRSGKKMVVTSLETSIHCVAVAFSSNGKFQIIDSMSSHVIDKDALEKKLNEATIHDYEEKPIQFSGTYINTHIQKGGHECLRFSALYCYQIFKTKKMDAFEEVNGAFVEGKLKRFEDYKKMGGSKKISNLLEYGRDLYTDFMRSWACRTFGWKQDTWKEIKVEDLREEWDPEDDTALHVYELFDSVDKPPFYSSSHGLTFLDAKENEVMPQEVSMPDDLLSCSLGSLTSTKERRFLVFEKNQAKPHFYRILPGQKLLSESSPGMGVYL